MEQLWNIAVTTVQKCETLTTAFIYTVNTGSHTVTHLRAAQQDQNPPGPHQSYQQLCLFRLIYFKSHALYITAHHWWILEGSSRRQTTLGRFMVSRLLRVG